MRSRSFRAAWILTLALAVVAPGCKKGPNSAASSRDSGLTAQQLYQKGLDLSKRGHYYRARTVLEKVLGKPGISRDLVADVNLALADAYYYDGGIINVAEALSRYTSFLTYYPAHPRADYAQYQLGLCYLKQALGADKDQEATHKALDELKKVARDHPDSKWVDPAREKIDVCRQRLAESEMNVGLFYLRKDAYPGAIERFRTIVEDYPNYDHMDRTLYELAEALKSSKKMDEAIIYFRKILQEYPKSRYSSKAQDEIADASGPGGRTAEASKKPEARKGKAVLDPTGGR